MQQIIMYSDAACCIRSITLAAAGSLVAVLLLVLVAGYCCCWWSTTAASPLECKLRTIAAVLLILHSYSYKALLQGLSLLVLLPGDSQSDIGTTGPLNWLHVWVGGDPCLESKDDLECILKCVEGPMKSLHAAEVVLWRGLHNHRWACASFSSGS